MTDYYLECDKCSDEVKLTRRRYLQLLQEGRLPRCRKNGCRQLFGPPEAERRRKPELDVIDVPPERIHWPKSKRGNANGALPKLTVSRDDRWQFEQLPDDL